MNVYTISFTSSFATLSSVGAVANNLQGGAVELSGEAREQWDNAVARLISVLKDANSRCSNFLQSKGLYQSSLSNILEDQKPYDGFASTNNEDFGAVAQSPKELFETYKDNGIPLDAATAGILGKIYYGNVRGGITSSLILHENLHRLDATLTDDILGQKLGTWKKQGNQDSGLINKTLKENGC